MEKKSATCRGGDAPCVLRNRRCSPCRRPTAWCSSHHRRSSTPRPRRAIPRAAPRATSGVASSCVRICRTAAKHRPKRRFDGRIGFRSKKIIEPNSRPARSSGHPRVDRPDRPLVFATESCVASPTRPHSTARPSPIARLRVGGRRSTRAQGFAVDRSGRGRTARGVTGDSPRRSRRRRRGFRRGVRGRSRARVYSRVFSLVRGSLESRDNAAVDAPLSKPRSRPTMKHGKTFRKLGRDSAHRWAMMRTMVRSSSSTSASAPRWPRRRAAGGGPRGDVREARHAQRAAPRHRGRAHGRRAKLFTELAERCGAGPGFTRVLQTSQHRSDSAQMAFIEYVDREASCDGAARRRARAELGCQGVRAEELAERGGRARSTAEAGDAGEPAAAVSLRGDAVKSIDYASRSRHSPSTRSSPFAFPWRAAPGARS